MHVLDEILKCSEKYDLSAWYSKAIFTGQAQSIEHKAYSNPAVTQQ